MGAGSLQSIAEMLKVTYQFEGYLGAGSPFADEYARFREAVPLPPARSPVHAPLALGVVAAGLLWLTDRKNRVRALR